MEKSIRDFLKKRSEKKCIKCGKKIESPQKLCDYCKIYAVTIIKPA